MISHASVLPGKVTLAIVRGWACTISSPLHREDMESLPLGIGKPLENLKGRGIAWEKMNGQSQIRAQ